MSDAILVILDTLMGNLRCNVSQCRLTATCLSDIEKFTGLAALGQQARHSPESLSLQSAI